MTPTIRFLTPTIRFMTPTIRFLRVHVFDTDEQMLILQILSIMEQWQQLQTQNIQLSLKDKVTSKLMAIAVNIMYVSNSQIIVATFYQQKFVTC